MQVLGPIMLKKTYNEQKKLVKLKVACLITYKITFLKNIRTCLVLKYFFELAGALFYQMLLLIF